MTEINIKELSTKEEKGLSLAALLAIQDKKAIIFTARKGYASGLSCKDCGHVFKCQSCEAPLTYHLKEPLPYLICRHCLAKYLPPNKCPNCGGYEFKYFGLASEKLQLEIKNKLKNSKIIVLDKNNIKTNKELMAKFKEIEAISKIAVIATELALKPQLPKFDVAIIACLEDLLSFPDYGVLEKTFRIIDFLKEKSDKLIIQTYNAGQDFLRLIESKDEFLEKELGSRKEFNLPPFISLIKIKFKHKDLTRSQKEMELLAKKLNQAKEKNEFNFEILGPTSAFIPKIKDFWIFEIILKYDKNLLSLRNRNSILKLIDGSKFIIDVDPITLI